LIRACDAQDAVLSSIPQKGKALREQQEVVNFAGGMLKKELAGCTYRRIESKEYIC
jgi:ribosomal protein S12